MILPAERLLLWKDVLANVAGVKVLLKQYSEVYFSTKNGEDDKGNAKFSKANVKGYRNNYY